MSTSFLVAGSVGVLANYALFSQYTPVSLDYLRKEMSAVVQLLNFVLPALFGFLGGTLILLVWNYLKSRVLRFLLEYDNWFLKPKQPINKVGDLRVCLWSLASSLLGIYDCMYSSYGSCS